MKHLLKTAVAAAMLATLTACSPTKTEVAAPVAPVEARAAAISYGDNAAAGATFTHDGVTFYYETYGEGEPLLMVHGNGASIASLGKQIEHFKSKYKVIAMDSREQGKSGISDTLISYEQMTDDLAALLDHLKTGPVDVLGWSDGGIEALMLGMRHPDRVKKLVAMAANLNPSLEAVYPETAAMVKQIAGSLTPEVLATLDGKKQAKLVNLMANQPNIAPKALASITAPTLVMSGDQDLIRLEHTVAIFNALPNAELAVFPNSTHAAPIDDPELFNATVERFLAAPFKKKDRVGDLIASIEKMMASSK